MTDVELAQLAALAQCSFSPGSTAKSFVRRLAGIARVDNGTYELTEKQTAFLDNLAHQYRKQIGKCMAVACMVCGAQPHVDGQEIAVALDAFIEGRTEYTEQVAAWRKVALHRYNAQFKSKFAHPYEYATKAKPAHRTAKTRGDIYCRFCGERLFCGVKQPHQIVKESAEAQRHLTICALQLLAGMREAAAPGYRTVPFEYLWDGRDVRLPLPTPDEPPSPTDVVGQLLAVESKR